MATSAIGPGFLTQTALFTGRHGADFGAAIVLSTLLDLGAQVVLWRMLVAAGRPAPALANAVAPGLGTAVAGLVALGGLAFNIGNIAGAGLGLEALLGVPVRWGAALSAGLAMALFLLREAGRAMDRVAQLLGGVMVLVTLGVAVSAAPPLGTAAVRAVQPEAWPWLAVVTLVGGTVGGYIPYAGAHRLLEQGLHGADGVRTATRAALLGIGVATAMRVALYLAALGIVVRGTPLDPANPAATVFATALGEAGRRGFGLVMWSAAITSVIGSAWTSVTFVEAVVPRAAAHRTRVLLAFIGSSALVFLAVGRPVALLVLAGALNGLVLPLSLGAILAAARRPALLNDLVPPRGLVLAGWGVALLMAALGLFTLVTELPKLLA